MTAIPALLAAVAGAMLPLQAAINSRLARLVGSPLWAASVSGLALTGALAAAALFATRAGPRLAGATAMPLWVWTGGLCGAVVLSATTAVTPRLGTATTMALVMAGQVVCSLLLDQFGLLGLDAHGVTLRRGCAALLLLAGAAFMR